MMPCSQCDCKELDLRKEGYRLTLLLYEICFLNLSPVSSTDFKRFRKLQNTCPLEIILKTNPDAY